MHPPRHSACRLRSGTPIDLASRLIVFASRSSTTECASLEDLEEPIGIRKHHLRQGLSTMLLEGHRRPRHGLIALVAFIASPRPTRSPKASIPRWSSSHAAPSASGTSTTTTCASKPSAASKRQNSAAAPGFREEPKSARDPNAKKPAERLLEPASFLLVLRAGKGIRTLDVHLGKVALYH